MVIIQPCPTPPLELGYFIPNTSILSGYKLHQWKGLIFLWELTSKKSWAWCSCDNNTVQLSVLKTYARLHLQLCILSGRHSAQYMLLNTNCVKIAFSKKPDFTLRSWQTLSKKQSFAFDDFWHLRDFTKTFILNSSPLDKVAAILQTIFSDAFSWNKSFVFCLCFVSMV